MPLLTYYALRERLRTASPLPIDLREHLALVLSEEGRMASLNTRCLLIAAPTAEAARALEEAAQLADVPAVSISATQLVEPGWAGLSPHDAVRQLVVRAGGPAGLATTGALLIIDDLDAFSRRARDMYRREVQVARQLALARMLGSNRLTLPSASRRQSALEVCADQVSVVAVGGFRRDHHSSPPTDAELARWGMPQDLVHQFAQRFVSARPTLDEIRQQLDACPATDALIHAATMIGVDVQIAPETMAVLAREIADGRLSVGAARARLVRVIEAAVSARANADPFDVAPNDRAMIAPDDVMSLTEPERRR